MAHQRKHRLLDERLPHVLPQTQSSLFPTLDYQATDDETLYDRDSSSSLTLEDHRQLVNRPGFNFGQISIYPPGKAAPPPIQRRSQGPEILQRQPDVSSNPKGLPDPLKTGTEIFSGYSMDDVQVHYNSTKPAQLQALAYTEGNHIHLGQGQEKHLPHEAWHVVQQKQNRVAPTTEMSGKQINDSVSLEQEADSMAQKVVSGPYSNSPDIKLSNNGRLPQNSVVQRMVSKSISDLNPTSKDDINSYIYSTIINKRKQTFSQAVNEFVDTSIADQALKNEVSDLWDDIKAGVSSDSNMTVVDLSNAIRQIINEINIYKARVPDHPNKPDVQPQEEFSGTIPITQESFDTAVQIKNAYENDYRDHVTENMYQPENDKIYLSYRGRDNYQLREKKKLNFMLGVMTLPDGKIIVSHSGWAPQLREVMLRRAIHGINNVRLIVNKKLKCYRAT